ncbi:zinc finger protein [Nephila pilipes]|uniref:Zinc finger protein n=1 Tax=Nephila pilipes TaxID=299642 RepID=A0A8X6MYF8_NEPPI|nr:zinc finger protein [Nephila pilipes]
MYNSNYGYPPGPSHQQSTSLPFSSTPSSNTRPQRPRFAFSGPSAYPRPRSSASKPNPDSYSENVRNNFEVFNEESKNNFPTTSNFSNSYQDEFRSPEGYLNSPVRNNYGNSSESLLNTPTRSSYANSSENYMKNFLLSKFGISDNNNSNVRGMPSDSMVNNYGNSNNRMDVSFSSSNNSPYPNNSSIHSLNDTAYYSCNESFYESPKKSPYLGNAPNMNFSPSSLPFSAAKLPLISTVPERRPDFQGHIQNKKDKFKSNLTGKPKSFYEKKFSQEKRTMATKGEWHCSVCCIDFTSNIPYEMHLRGAKHAKKLKLKDALQLIQMQVSQNTEIAPIGKSFRCDLCNITANSSLQLQTHLDGTKHKNKLLQQQQPKENKEESDSTEVNGKSNGSALIRPLPAEFGEPQPTKIFKFSCDTCNVTLNSDIQLQQHLTSKKHQAKVEGKPFQKKKFKTKKGDDEKAENEMTNTEATEGVATETVTGYTNAEETNTTEARKMIVGVKTLSASFVQGDTLH